MVYYFLVQQEMYNQNNVKKYLTYLSDTLDAISAWHLAKPCRYKVSYSIQ